MRKNKAAIGICSKLIKDTKLICLVIAGVVAFSTIVQGAVTQEEASETIRQAGNHVQAEAAYFQNKQQYESPSYKDSGSVAGKAAAMSVMESFDEASKTVIPDEGRIVEGLYCVDEESAGINAFKEILAVDPEDEGVIQLVERLSGITFASIDNDDYAKDGSAVGPDVTEHETSDNNRDLEHVPAAMTDASEPEEMESKAESDSGTEEKNDNRKRNNDIEKAPLETIRIDSTPVTSGKTSSMKIASVNDEAEVFDESKSQLLRAGNDVDDRQHGEAVPFVPGDTKDNSMAYVSGFVLTGLRDGSGDWDDHTDTNGYDSSDSNKIVRTHDDITYYMSYSTALNEAYRYKTISGAKLYLQYTLPVSSSKAQFNLDAMPWLKGSASGGRPVVTTSNGGNTQTLIGYRDLPDNTDEYGSYDVPGAGTVNCVIHVYDMKSGEVIQPSFKAWLQAKNNSAAPSYAVTAAAGSTVRDTKVTVSVGAHLYMTISADRTTIANYGSYTGLSKSGSNITFSGRLKGFNYTIKTGKMNGSMRGTAPLKAGSRIKVNFKLEGTATADPAGTDIALWAVRTKGNDVNDALGHSYTEYPGLEQYYTNSDTGFGHASSVAVSGGKFSFVITGFSGRQPGSKVSEGLIVCSQRMPSSGPNTYHYVASVTLESADMTADDGRGERNVSLAFPSGSSIYPSASHENAVTPPGSYNITLHLKSTEANEDGERAFLSGTDTSTANTIGFGKEFYVTANNTNILYDADKRIHSYNQYILWDNRMVEPVIKNGRLDAVIASQSGWSGYYYLENYPIRFITKKDGKVWTGIDEMKTASLKTYDDLRFYDSYSSVPSGYKICGILVEGRNLREEILGTDNIHGIEFRMKTVSDSSVINNVAMFTHSADAYLENKAGISRAASNGIGSVMPDGDRISFKMNDRSYVRTGWNTDGTVDSSTLTSNNTVFQGNSLLIKGYTCTVDMKHLDGTESKTMDIGTIRSVECKVSPKLDGGNLHTRASSTVLTISIPDGLEFAELAAGANNSVIQLNKSYSNSSYASGSRGSFKAEKSGNELRITFTDAVSDYALPVFKIKYNLKSGVLKNGMTVDMTSKYTGDWRSIDKLNGNIASVAMRIVETEASVLKETVNKATAKNDETLIYTITYLNTSGDKKPLNISCPKPINQDADGTSFSGGGMLQYKSATAAGNRGSSITVSSSAAGINATGNILPGEEANIVITYQLKDADDGDVIRNHCTQKETNGTIISNSVETVVEAERGDISFRKTASDYSWPLAGVSFKITYIKTGETATIMTGNDGRYSSAEASSGRIWFGKTSPDASKGALPYGTYRLQELSGGPAAKSESLVDRTFEISKNTVNSTTGIYNLGDLTNTFSISISKDVDRISNDLGEKHTWTVDASVPPGISADNGDCSYQLRDPIDSRLNYEGSLRLYMISGNQQTLLAKTTDYTLQEPSGNGGGTILINMTKNGIRKLEKADSVRLVFMTSINATASAKTHIPNQASLIFAGFGKTKTIVSNQPYVYTGKISIMKKDSASGEALSGVVFRLYKIDSDGSESPVSRSGKVLEAVTDSNGKAEFFGLKDGAYRAIETKAAARHQLLTSKIDITIGQGDSGTITVENDKGPRLDAGGRGNRIELFLGLACVFCALTAANDRRKITSIVNGWIMYFTSI